MFRQWHRHRTWSYNELSARYRELPEEFYIPKEWRRQDTKNKQGSVVDEEWGDDTHDMFSQFLRDSCREAYQTYEWYIANGVAREMARMVLPINIYTEIYACWDLKNLLHFITLRDDSHAQFEIAEYGKAIKQICQELFPWTLEAFESNKSV